MVYICLLAATNPARNNPNSHFLTSINAVAGIAWEGFRFGYSYSFNMSDIGRDGGVYELSCHGKEGMVQTVLAALDTQNNFSYEIFFSFYIHFILRKPSNFSM